MQTKTFLHNKNIYSEYNNFRKEIFSQFAPRDSEEILYLLPWLLSVNHPSVPGYIKDLKKQFKVYSIEKNREIIKRERIFKTLFNIRKEETFLKFPTDVNLIQGIYTIGSVGTISQTSRSDCDIWICFHKKSFDEKTLQQFTNKINLVKDWFDANLKMPVFFFVSDVEDIKSCNFGRIDHESSGSIQKNILKEEFYRTTILICGKIPLWWVCHDEEKPVDYCQLVEEYDHEAFADYDCIDLGNLETVDRGEYFGAALWQFNKALTHPLKSIIKMLLLEMLIVSPREELLCRQFRRSILSQAANPVFFDPSMFTMEAVLKYNENIDPDTFEFIEKCFYLRYEIKLLSKKLTLKENLCKDIFVKYPFDRNDIYHLNNFSSWPFYEQKQFGDSVLALLRHIYKGITTLNLDITNGINPQDLTIMGRKLSSCLGKKTHKVPIIHKTTDNLNLPVLTFHVEGKRWQVYPAGEPSQVIIESTGIVYCLAYLIWNDIFLFGQVRMNPNPTPVTLQEIMNLAKRIHEIFGIYDAALLDFDNFLKPERISKMLLVVSFEGAQHNKDMNDLCIIYKSNWGELFVRRFKSLEQLKEFVNADRDKFDRVDIHYYVQRSCQYYEKIIERTKSIISQAILKK